MVLMDMVHTIMIILGLSLDSFVVMMNKGATVRQILFSRAALYALIYAAVRVLAVLVGYSASFLLEDMVNDRLEISIACLIIFTIGLYLCFRACMRREPEEKLDRLFDLRACFMLAVLTSIETLLLAVGFSLFDISLATVSLLTFAITFAGVLAAFAVGYFEGPHYTRQLSFMGGFLMIVFGLYLIVHYVMLLR